jgi:molybdate transport system substrate-binding protein
VLSAGAIEPGLVAAARAFGERNGGEVVITWATTPSIRRQIADGALPDIVIVPPDAVDEFDRGGKVFGREAVRVGRVGIGVVMRNELAAPDLSTLAAFERALLDAESVVFNRASSGLYVEAMLRGLDILPKIEAKTTRYDTGPAMMDHLIHATNREIGIGAIVEILMFREQGLKLAAPLPPEIQHDTTYMAVPIVHAQNLEGARAFLAYLADPEGQAQFSRYGIV